MLKKLVAKKFIRFSFNNDVVELGGRDFRVFLNKEDINDIYFYPDLLRVVFITKWDRFNLAFENEKHQDIFFREFNSFFKDSDYSSLKRKIYFGLIKWILLSALGLFFLNVLDLKNGTFFTQLILISLVLFPIVVCAHIKKLDLIFKEKIRI